MCNFAAEIVLTTVDDRARLFEIWQSSVRATHLFLSESHIQTFIPLVKEEIAHFTSIHCIRDSAGLPIAFMGVAAGKIEMLFVAPACRGLGLGRKLVNYAVEHLDAQAVDVNEQNEQAVGFYERLGFRTVSRSEQDPFGNPFPILHLKLAQ